MGQIKLSRFLSSGLLGLHFTPEEMFVGVCQRHGRTYELDSLDCLNIKEHVLEGGEYNQMGLVPLIHDVLKKHKVKTRKTVVSFPVKFPWIRTIEVPMGSKQEMDQMVRLEIERLYLDSTVDKLFDYHVLDTAEVPSPEGTVNVLSCAIPRNSVAPYVDLCAAANLELVGIDISEVSVIKLAGMQRINFNEGISIILNINMESTDLMLMEDNNLQLVRKVGQGKLQLRELIQNNLHDDDPARHGLDRLDYTLPSEFLNFASEYVANLLGEIRRSIEFYLTDIKRAEGNVSKVILAGSGFWPTNFADILAMQLHLPLITLNFTNFPNVSVKTVFKPEFPTLSVYAPVIGSVLRGVA